MKLPFKFTITNEIPLYYLVDTGDVVTTPILTYLPPTIVDWNTLTLNYKRDMTFLGIIKGYSPQRIRFVKDAAKILRFIKNREGGAEAIGYLGMYLWDPSTYQYVFLDYWQFDFSQSKNYLNFFDCALMEGGLAALIKAYGPNNYVTPLNDPALAPNFPAYNPMPINALPLTVPPTNYIGTVPNEVYAPVPQLILMDGIPIKGTQQYVTSQPGEFFFLEDIPESETGAFGTLTVPALAASSALGDYEGSVGRTNINIMGNHTGVDPILNVCSFLSVGDSNFQFAYNLLFRYRIITGTHSKTMRLRFRIEIWDGGGVFGGGWGTKRVLPNRGIIFEDVPEFMDIGLNPWVERHWVGLSVPFELNPFDIVCFGFSWVAVAGWTGADAKPEIEFRATDTYNPLPAITMRYSFVPESSVCRAISHGQLFEYLTAQMSTNGGALPNAYKSRSNLLNSFRRGSDPGNWDRNPQATFFTCGDSLRGLDRVTTVDPFYPPAPVTDAFGNVVNPGDPFDTYVVPAIYTNMNDFNRDLQTDLCGAIGIERTGIGTDVLVVEEMYYFFDDSVVIADLGSNISDFEMTDFNDYRGSGITVGQTDQQFDSINGPLETMSTVDIATNMTRVIKNINWQTPYREDPYGIEGIRANLGNKTNTNSSSDNDTVKLAVTGTLPTPITFLDNTQGLSGYEPGIVSSGVVSVDVLLLQRAVTALGIVSGLPSDLLTPAVFPYGMYNLSATPHRKALRALPWLCSNYRDLLDSLLPITGYKKNIKLVSDLGSGPIAESDWLNVSEVAQTYTPPFSLGPVTIPPAPIPAGRTTNLIWKPHVFSFIGPSIKDLPVLMTPPGTPGGGKMYGKIKFKFKRSGRTAPLAGFVLDVGIVPGTKAAYNYRLLCSPTTVIPDWL